MSEEITHKQEFTIRDLPTTSVTFYPGRASIVRDVQDITLKVGGHPKDLI